jgi:hypothetical protein
MIIGCNFNANVSYENEEKEKEDAQSVIALFYMYSNKNDMVNIVNLFSDSFFKITNKQELRDFLSYKQMKLGEFKDYSLKDWKTNRVKGTNPKTEYLLIYDVKYSSYNAIETISLIKEDGKIKIFGYDVDSLGLKNK